MALMCDISNFDSHLTLSSQAYNTLRFLESRDIFHLPDSTQYERYMLPPK